MRHVASLAAAALLAASAASAAYATPANIGSFRDWRTACDNTGDCMAVGFTAGEYVVGPYVVVRRRAGPDSTVGLSLVLADDESEPKDGDRVTLSVTGGARPATFSGVASTGEDAFPHVDFEGSAALALLTAIRNGTAVEVSVNDAEIGSVSLSGSSAALRWIDDRQGRAGGVTALVATGSRPAAAVPAARPLPIIRLGAPVNQDDLPTAFPATLANRADVKACVEDQADPEGDFGKPEAQARLTETEYLWAIPCGRGAYNFSSHYIIARADGSGARSPGLGDDDTVVNAGYDPESRTMGAFNKGRGFGDCGSSDNWAWDGRRFMATEHAEMDDCRAVPSEDWLVTWRAEAR